MTLASPEHQVKKAAEQPRRHDAQPGAAIPRDLEALLKLEAIDVGCEQPFDDELPSDAPQVRLTIKGSGNTLGPAAITSSAIRPKASWSSTLHNPFRCKLLPGTRTYVPVPGSYLYTQLPVHPDAARSPSMPWTCFFAPRVAVAIVHSSGIENRSDALRKKSEAETGGSTAAHGSIFTTRNPVPAS